MKAWVNSIQYKPEGFKDVQIVDDNGIIHKKIQWNPMIQKWNFDGIVREWLFDSDDEYYYAFVIEVVINDKVVQLNRYPIDEPIDVIVKGLDSIALRIINNEYDKKG